MPSNIAIKQNAPENLRLLAAQRHIYSQAKKIRRWRMSGAIGLAFISPIILFFWPNSQSVMAVTGGVWTLIAFLVLDGIEAKKKKQAATIQEQFDVELFGLPWNQTLVKNKLTPEIIHEADRAFKGERDKLKDWYADPENIPHPLDVFLCQRSNIVWDWRLRRHYGWVISILTVILFSVDIVLAAAMKQTLINYILGLFLPSLSAYLQGVNVAKKHFQTASHNEELEREISALWETGMEDPCNITLEQCRRIQDCIFYSRKNGPLVPDRWYKWLRDRYQVDMFSAVQEFKKQAEGRA